MKQLAAILILTVGLLNGNVTEAQKNNFLKVHGGLELPVGIFNDGYKAGVGLYVTDYLEVGNRGSVVFSTGVASWKAKVGTINAGLSLTRVGYRQFLVNELYLQADGGIGILLGNWGKGSHFTYGAGLGYLLKVNENSGVDFNFRYNHFGYRSWLGIGVGYQFKL